MEKPLLTEEGEKDEGLKEESLEELLLNRRGIAEEAAKHGFGAAT